MVKSGYLKIAVLTILNGTSFLQSSPLLADTHAQAQCTPDPSSVLGSAAAMLTQVDAAVKPSDAVYDSIYPTYAEMCGASQKVQKAVGDDPASTGGPFGHGFFYLKGVCRDENAPYPKIHMCTASDPGEHGVGVSLDADFKNVDWIAVPGKNFFLHGLAGPNGPLDLTTYQKTKEAAESLDLLKGVTFTDAFYSKLKTGNERAPAPGGGADHVNAEMYQALLGTDYAVQNGRNLFCVKVPLQASELAKMVTFLNSRNDYYQANQNFVWGPTNNCVTTTDNALAAAGFWNPLPIGAPFYAFGHVAIPLDSFAKWVLRTHDLPIEDPIALYEDPNARKMLLTTGALPLRPGVVTEYFGINPGNAVFSHSVDETFISLPPVFGVTHSKFKKLTHAPQYLQLDASLLDLQARLLKIKANRQPEDVLGRHFSRGERLFGDTAQFSDFYADYYNWVDQTLSQIQNQLSQISLTPSVP